MAHFIEEAGDYDLYPLNPDEEGTQYIDEYYYDALCGKTSNSSDAETNLPDGVEDIDGDARRCLLEDQEQGVWMPSGS